MTEQTLDQWCRQWIEYVATMQNWKLSEMAISQMIEAGMAIETAEFQAIAQKQAAEGGYSKPGDFLAALKQSRRQEAENVRPALPPATITEAYCDEFVKHCRYTRALIYDKKHKTSTVPRAHSSNCKYGQCTDKGLLPCQQPPGHQVKIECKCLAEWWDRPIEADDIDYALRRQPSEVVREAVGAGEWR